MREPAPVQIYSRRRSRRFYGHSPGQPLDRPDLTFSCLTRHELQGRYAALSMYIAHSAPAMHYYN